MHFVAYAKRGITVLLAVCLYHAALAQDTAKYNWWNPVQHSFPVIEGQAWPKEAGAPYDRLPARAEKIVSKPIWYLSHQGAGLAIRFRTTAKEITVRYTVANDVAMPHMPATGVSGVDLYAIDKNGEWKWAAGKYKFSDTITYRFANLGDEAREYRLYLPLYNQVKWMEIGTPAEAALTPLPVRKEKPIVVYGTSIAQGACASRPGMAWTSLLDRAMDRQVINLGFSGNGRLDPGIVDMLTEIDAKVYVLDCMPNLSGNTPEDVYQRVINAVKKLQQKRPGTPILLVGHSAATIPQLNSEQAGPGRARGVNSTMMNAYQSLQAEGVKNVYLLPADKINLDISATVDGVHPSDAGMLAYARAYEQSLRAILHEPSGKSATQQPCRQYRELSRYDWEARHHEILELNRRSAPRVVLLGNSITHYWGGLPKAPISRGESSWKKVLDPAGARNFGFGWDRIENVLWRVYHDELDGFTARKIVVLIGTNNLAINTDEEIAAGLNQLVAAIQQRQPKADILLSGLLPRKDMEPRIRQINNLLLQVAAGRQVQYIDPGQVLLQADKTIDAGLFTDGLHPNEAGYSKLAAFLRQYLK